MKNRVKTIKRPSCAITNDNLFELFTFKRFPVKSSCENIQTTKANDVFSDMKFGCSMAGIVQLMELIPQHILYDNYHNTGNCGHIWETHHLHFSEFIKTENFHKTLEIGGSNGSLVKHFLVSDSIFEWNILEPSLDKNKIIQDHRIKYINNFIEKYESTEMFDAVIHSHVLEHIFNPIEYMLKINSMLKSDGVHFISLPNMKYWLEHNFSNTLFFEHTYYIDENVIEYLLNISGFQIVNKVINNHSIFIKAIKNNNMSFVDINFAYIKDIFLNYIKYITQDTQIIVDAIANKKIFLFGGHIFTQMLLNLGVDENLVINILDNDMCKQEKRLYGTDLIIKHPNILSNYKEPIVVLRAGIYSEEIKKTILNINNSTIFI